MKRRLGCAAAFAAALALTVAHAQQGPAAGFRYERAVGSVAGPNRLAIDVPLLAGATPFTVVRGRAGGPVAENGLRDLRIFGPSGTLVPHLLVYAPRTEPEWTEAAVLPVANTEKTSGFEADFGRPLTVDAMSVSGIPAPFLKRMTLEGSGDRTRWTILVADGTLFDLPNESLRQTQLAFAPGSYRYLRVTWDDRNSARVPPPSVVRARRVTSASPPPALTAPLVFERRPSEPGVSRFRVKLPGPHLPIVALDFDVRPGHLLRAVSVSESRLSGSEAVPAELGRDVLKRVERDGLAAASMRIPILAPAEAELELAVDDGNNTPLDLVGITAVFAELPWMYFEAPGGTLVARYGNPSAVPPVYDLEAVRDSLNVASVPDARWGDARELARADAPAPASPMPDTGAAMDVGGFAYTRALPDGEAGLVALALDPAALAHSRGPASRFADVRVVDPSSRQVPYLVERRNEPLPVTLSLARADSAPAELTSASGHSRSTYRLQLPYGNLPGARIALETSARVFQRSLQLSVVRPPDRQRRDPRVEVIGLGSWAHAAQDTAAPALILPLGPTDTTDVLLTVDEGDNSPLPITSVTLLLPSYRLRFYRPATAPLRLVYGSREVLLPHYDLALLAPQVMGVEAREILPGPETGSPAATHPALVSPFVFWALLGIAVVVLLALIARLAITHT